MNRKDLLNMKPGRELDTLVAQKVLGFSDCIDENRKSIKDFSTNPSHLWTIIESMINKNFVYNIANNRDEHTCVFDNTKTHRRYVVHAKTPMEAICKASVMAVVF